MDTRNLASKLIGETITVKFDFHSLLVYIETLSAPVVEVTLLSGIDYHPEDILLGSAAISGTVISQQITLGMPAVIYNLTCTVNSSIGITPIGTYAISKELAILSDLAAEGPTNPPQLTGDLPDGVPGVAYSSNLIITNGYPPYVFDQITSGTPPAWMHFEVFDDLLICDGVPDETVVGTHTYIFNPQILDSANQTADEPQEVNVIVPPPPIPPTDDYNLVSSGASVLGRVRVSGGLPTEISSPGTPRFILLANRDTDTYYERKTGTVNIVSGGGINGPLVIRDSVDFGESDFVVIPDTAAMDEDSKVCAFSDDNSTLIFIHPDDTNSTITGLARPKHVISVGEGQFAVNIYNDGHIFIYGPSNNYAAPLIDFSNEFNIYSMTADIAGRRIFTQQDLGPDIIGIFEIDTLLTGSIPIADAGDHISYCASLDLLVFTQMNHGGKVYVWQTDGTPVHEIDLDFGTSPESPIDIQIMEDLGYAVVVQNESAGADDNFTVYIINLTTGDIEYSKTYPTNVQVQMTTVDEGRNRVYVGNTNFGDITIIDALTLTEYSTEATIDLDCRVIAYGKDFGIP